MRPLRERRVGTVVRRVETVGSTMDAVRELGKDGAVLIADEQTRGRGRQGRAWHSPEGGLYMSVLLKPRVGAEASGLMPLWTGLAVCEASRGMDLEPRLAWPNDVVVGTKKLGGVLCESEVAGSRVDRAVLGIGVNVNNCIFPEDVRGTSLRLELGEAVELEAFTDDLMERLTDHYNRFLTEPVAFLDDYERCCTTLGRNVAADTAAGTVKGAAVGVGEQGELMVRTGEGVEAVHAGDVVELET